MYKDYGEIEISEGLIIGNYYRCSKRFDDNVYEVELKYLGEKDGYHKFLDEDELDVVEFSGNSLESCDHNFGTYTLLSNKNVLKWRVYDINFKFKHFTLELSKDGRTVSTTVSIEYPIKTLAQSLGVKL